MLTESTAADYVQSKLDEWGCDGPKIGTVTLTKEDGLLVATVQIIDPYGVVFGSTLYGEW